MGVPANVLQAVQTYQKAGLAFLQNSNCFINLANTKFKDFQNITANLGSTVSFDLPPRMTTTNSLVANFQPAEQRVETLTVDQAISSSYAFTSQQFIFNVEEYMDKFGKAAIAEIGANIEANVALNCETQPYRFYGDGVTPINSFGQLASALALYRNYGAVNYKTRGVLSDIAVPTIVNSGLGQFAPKRNDMMSNSWELGDFAQCSWHQSNLLPVHTAGTAGDSALNLTVTATTTDAAGAVTAITFSVAGAPGADANMIKQHDRLRFNDGVAGQTNLRYLTFVGHKVSQNPVQFRATADAASTAGSLVTVTVDPPLQVNPTNDQNINTPIAVGHVASVLPSHRAGVIMSGDPLFLAMPRLPDQSPFATAAEYDQDTGCSLRMTHGAKFGLNEMGNVHDGIWGSKLVPEDSMAVIFPL